MKPGTEALLVGLVFALYLADCVRLLEPDEALLVSRDGRRWAARFGASNWRLAGREPFLSNPLLPDQAVFRLRWRFLPAAGAAHADAPRATLQMAPQAARLGRFAWATWIMLFVVLPVCLLARLGPAVTLPALGLMYACVLASLAATWRWRQPLGVGGAGFWKLAFECLACPPYAANIVRKVVALGPTGEDFEAAAARLLDGEALQQARAQCLARLDEQIERVGDDTPDAGALLQARQRFLS